MASGFGDPFKAKGAPMTATDTDRRIQQMLDDLEDRIDDLEARLGELLEDGALQ
jgi:hypothetical protein